MIAYPRLIVMQTGQMPNLKNVSNTLLCNGKFAGITGQFFRSPSGSSIPQMFMFYLFRIFNIFLSLSGFS
jgi:hypothetical protein